jgi:hypothetical protein
MHQPQETELHVLFSMRRDERALALAAHQQVLGSEFVDRLAHRALAHLEARRQFHLARNDIARTPFGLLQAAHDQRLDLLVQRAEGRPRRRVNRLGGPQLVGARCGGT